MLDLWKRVCYDAGNKKQSINKRGNMDKKDSNYLVQIIILLLTSAVTAVLSLLLAVGVFDVALFFDYFRHPLVFLLNCIPVFFVQAILYCITNRHWVAYSLTGLVVLLLSAADFFKLKFRSEPLVAIDFSFMGEGLSIARSYNLELNRRLLVCLSGFLVLCFLAGMFARGRINGRKRAFTAALLLAALFSCIPVYRSNALYYGGKIASEHVVTDWEEEDYVSKGFVYPLLHDALNQKSDEEIHPTTLNELKGRSLPTDRKPDIIVMQLEAFSDLRTIGIEGIHNEAYGIYDTIRAGSISGALFVNVFAGGTIDTEHCVLTGEREFRPVKADTDSYVRYLKEQGYFAFGNHPNNASFYNRGNVNRYLGFDEYHYKDDTFEEMIADLQPSSWYSDCVLFPEILQQYEKLTALQQPLFSFNVTMQGHSPFSDDHFLSDELLWDGAGYSDETRYILNNYLYTVSDTQLQLHGFLKNLEEAERPVIVVLYGDHKPWLGDDNSVYDELGINMDPSDEIGDRNHFTTEYVIWRNQAAKQLAGENLPESGEDLHASQLMLYLLESLLPEK